MKKILSLSVLLLTAMAAFSQSTDSVKYYNRKAADIAKEYMKEALRDERMVAIQENLTRVIAKTDNYSAVTFYTQFTSVDYGKFNADNAQAGFNALSSPAIGLGVGFSFKKNRAVWDINLTSGGFDQKVTKGNEVIRATFSSFLQLSVGYDFIKSRSFNVYPYVGFSCRFKTIEYESPAQLNISPVSIAQLVGNDRSLTANRTDFCYQAGVAAEVLLSSTKRLGGSVFFIRGGTERAFKDNIFDIHGYKYDADFNAGKWVAAAGFKFFGR